MVSQKDRPLAGVGNVRCLAHYLDDRVAFLLPQCHEHPRHERKVVGHVALVALAEVLAHVSRPLVRLGQQRAVGKLRVQFPADALEHGVGFWQVLVDRALALDQVRDGVEPQGVDPHPEPELHHVDDGFEHRRVVEIEVGLMREEPVPVVLAGDRVERPV